MVMGDHVWDAYVVTIEVGSSWLVQLNWLVFPCFSKWNIDQIDYQRMISLMFFFKECS